MLLTNDENKTIAAVRVQVFKWKITIWLTKRDIPI